MMVRSAAMMAAGIVALLAGPAWGQGSPANVMREWGLIGAWALRCNAPPSMSNIYAIYVVAADGRAYHERDFADASRNDRSEVTAAELRTDGTLAITIDFRSLGHVRRVVFAKDGNRIRAMENRGPEGFSVVNGFFRHNNQPTPWQYKCR